jgi:type II secretory ATPase GspE/PulE/Tfp pilus assembly ATPase PilB-like protein
MPTTSAQAGTANQTASRPALPLRRSRKVKAETTARINLRDILLRRFPVGPDVLATAMRTAEESKTRLEIVLRRHDVVSDSQMALAVAEYLKLPPIDLSHFSLDEALLHDLPPKATAELRAIPIGRWANTLAIALADPFDQMAIDELAELTGCRIVQYVAPEGQVARLLEGSRASTPETLQDVFSDVSQAEPEFEAAGASDDGVEVSVEEMVGQSGEDPVVRVVNSMLLEALRRRASDIHLEPMERDVCVRYRVDGILYDMPGPPKHMQWPIVARLKIIAGLDIAECRLPQDGRFTIRALGKEADVRVSIIRTVHGQKVVMRLLDKGNLSPSVSALGLEPDTHRMLMYAISQPHGMILVTGPTGSGKTTTLYSILQELNKTDVNIVTIEDPVEYQIHRVNQIQTHPEIGMTFAAGLRSILRQDPDVVLVGEIRDHETASIAIQAAMTGHLVLSTLHTNDAAGAVTRLVHMGIEPFLIASSLLLAQAQRIYRKLCPACRRKRALPTDILRGHGIDPGIFHDMTLFGPFGCPQCRNIGYRGRAAIMELLPVDEEVRELILRRASAGAMRSYAVGHGMMSLRDAGFLRVRKGDTSIEEILRVTVQG